ncbi:MAG: hypothetical protein HRT67_04130 [Flavobacteriaceae bacterium]|nr:hypothetical protein [Flavobacteriaceae bacterium]
MGKCIAYYINQYHKLETVTLDPRLELGNNLAEDSITPSLLLN